MARREWRSVVAQDVRAIPTICQQLDDEGFDILAIFPSVIINKLAPNMAAPVVVVVASRPKIAVAES